MEGCIGIVMKMEVVYGRLLEVVGTVIPTFLSQWISPMALSCYIACAGGYAFMKVWAF